MVFDSQSTKLPSWITGTSRLGFFSSSAASCSTCSNGRSSSAQVHSTLRTLMEDSLPRTRRVMFESLLQTFDALDLSVDDRHDHRRRPGTPVIGPDLGSGLAGPNPQAIVAIASLD